MLVDGEPVKVIAPCEGTGYQAGSMSLVKGARNLDAAKQFFDWALMPKSQIAALQAQFFHVQPNKNTPAAVAPKIDVMLMDYDFAKYGATAERKRLLLRWDSEVKGATK